MKKDFAIINWWWADDHGAILTAYALQQFITECGYSSELLKCWKNYSEEKRKQGISNKFSSKYMSISDEEYSTYQDLFEKSNNEKIMSKYVAFITGSDQVFRAEWVPDSWFLTFVNGKGKIALSASFGKNDFTCPDSNRYKRIRKSIESFDFLSVREDEGVSLCKRYFNREALWLLDPVFLVDDILYHNLADTIAINGSDYIFCYVRDINTNVTSMINRIADEHKCQPVYCSESMEIEEFLFYIKHSKMIITDSYHGLCFSIIFNKDFLCILNVLRGKSRFESLARQLGLPHKNFVEEKDITLINNLKTINYYPIIQTLNANRTKDRELLKKVLCDIYKKYV